jgi:hypothetical protein
MMVVSAVSLAAMVAGHPGATCEFRVDRARGAALPLVLLEDKKAGVTGVCKQLVPRLVGYRGE